jgi:hypothetical protein
VATADEITQQQKALVVALELLRNQIQSNELALAANTQRVGALMSWYAYHLEQFVGAAGGGAPAGPMPTATPVATPVTPTATPVATVIETAEQRNKRQQREEEKRRSESWRKAGDTMKQAASPLTSVFAMVGAKFAAVAGPLAVLAQVLSSATSGFQTFGKAAQLMGSALAPILLPVVLMMATSMTAFAELISQVGGPAMQDFFEIVVDAFVPCIELAIETFIVLADVAKGVAGVIKELGNAAVFWTAALSGRGSRETRGRVDGAMRDVLESFRRSIGPKAQISGLGEVGKSVQLAALNADPLEARLMRQQLAVLERIAAAVERRRSLDAAPRVHDPVARGLALRDELIGDARAFLARLGVI